MLAVYCIGVAISLLSFTGADPSTRALLLDAVKANSSAHIRPVHNYSQPVLIHIQFYLYQVNDVDVVNQAIDLTIWSVLRWQNDLVAWDPALFDGVDRVDFYGNNQVWIPDLVIYERIMGDRLTDKPKEPIFVDHTGLTELGQSTRSTFSCTFDADAFPFDKHICYLTIGPWTYMKRQLDIEANVTSIRWLQQNEIWDVHSLDSAYTINSYEDPEPQDPFAAIVYSLKVERRSSFFVGNIILPAFFINFLGLAMFFIPCASGEKVGYGVTVYLAQTVNLIVVSDMIPQGGNRLPLFGQYLIFSLVFMASGLFATIFTLNIAFSPNPCEYINPATTKLSLKYLAPIFGPKFRKKGKDTNMPTKTLDNKNAADNDDVPGANGRPGLQAEEESLSEQDVLVFCESLNRLLGCVGLVILTLVTLIFYLQMDS